MESTIFTGHQGLSSGQQDVWDVYRREKQLGTGSFGTAYQAVNIKTHEERVIKAVARRQTTPGVFILKHDISKKCHTDIERTE